MPGMPGMGPIGMPSPLERIAEEVRDAPRPSMRKQAAPRRPAPQPQQAFTPLPSGDVGSSFGPGGLNPGPRGMGATAPPPPAFGGGAYEEDYGGPVSGPPVFNAEPDEDEEMTITEMALMDHAARRGYDPEDLVMQYDASTAEEMRDAAMRRFYERQQARGPGGGTNNPFAPAGMRRGPSGPAPASRNTDPAAAGGALAARLANKRRREEEEARRAQAAAAPPPAPAAASEPARPAAVSSAPPAADDDGAIARLLARRRQALLGDEPSAEVADEDEIKDEVELEPEEPSVAPGRRHAASRAERSSGLRAVPLEPVVDESAPSLEDMAASTTTRRPAKKAAKARTTKKAAKAAPAAKKAVKARKAAAPAAKAPAAKVPAAKGKKAGATLAKPVAKAAPAKSPAATKVGKAKTVFCIECGEKNPAIAKFCFNCGTRLAAPEN